MQANSLTYLYDPVDNIFIGSENPIYGKIPHVMWHITDVCSLKCPYCFSQKTGISTTVDQVPLIVDRLKHIGVLKVDVSGGEPLQTDVFPHVIDCLERADIFSTVTTSGVGNASNIETLLERLNNISRLLVSIDGPSSKDHDNQRHYNGAWEAALQLIDSLSLIDKKQKLRINTVITRPFIDNESWLPRMAEIIALISPREWCLIQPHPANEKRNFNSLKISDSDYLRIIGSLKSLKPGCKILTRSCSLYSTYWTLQPSGVISQHTNGPDDRHKINILSQSKETVLTFINETETIIPMRSQS